MHAGTFRGGIHPPENKHGTDHLAVRTIPLPLRVVIPLHQHTGAPASPLVQVGQTVQAGQKIAEASGVVSAAVHASIGGTVVAIGPHPHPALPNPVVAVTIERAAGEPAGASGPEWDDPVEWRSFSEDDLRSKIREAGIVGLGGAAFPAHVKLTPPQGKRVDSLIINGVECEPFLTNDHRLMLEKPREILEGIRILMKILGLARAVLAIEKNKPDAISLFQGMAGELNGSITVLPLTVKYPQGAEKQLVKAVLGREVPSGGLPFDVGAVVHNVGTALAVYEAVALGKPLIERVITVGGDGVATPANLRVRIGTLFSEILEFCGGYTVDGPVKLIMGGPMMGIAQYTDGVPVVKGTSGILVLSQAGAVAKETACIRCGRCVAVCPMALTPNRLADYAGKDDFDACTTLGVRDCIECGACTYTCGSHRPIVHLVKYAKWNLARKARKK